MGAPPTPETSSGKQIDLGLDKVKAETHEELAGLKFIVENEGELGEQGGVLMSKLANDAKVGMAQDLTELGVSNPDQSEEMEEYAAALDKILDGIKQDGKIESSEYKTLEEFINNPKKLSKLNALMASQKTATNIDEFLETLKGFCVKGLEKYTGKSFVKAIAWLAKIMKRDSLFGISAQELDKKVVAVAPTPSPEAAPKPETKLEEMDVLKLFASAYESENPNIDKINALLSEKFAKFGELAIKPEGEIILEKKGKENARFKIEKDVLGQFTAIKIVGGGEVGKIAFNGTLDGLVSAMDELNKPKTA